MKLGALFFALHIALSPVYVFSSGVPQPADFLIPAGAVILVLARPRISFPSPQARSFFLSSLLFFSWILLVSILNSLESGLVDIMRAPLFGFFNFLVLLVAFGALQHSEHPDKLISNALTASTIVMFLGLVVNFSGSGRQMAMFNNPNQLAYFSALTLGALIFSLDRFDLVRLKFFITAGMLIIANISAASLTGYAAVVLLMMAWAFKIGYRKLLVALLVVILLAPFLQSYLLELRYHQVLEIFYNRILLLDDKLDGGFDERGYDRIREFPQYLIFGAGEGGLSRFGIEYALELHSTFGTLLFSYGIIGLLIFLNLLRIATRSATFDEILVLSAPFVYGITHHGFRFSTFWLFMAIFVFLREKRATEASSINGQCDTVSGAK